jgi:hypothetical protein
MRYRCIVVLMKVWCIHVENCDICDDMNIDDVDNAKCLPVHNNDMRTRTLEMETGQETV